VVYLPISWTQRRVFTPRRSGIWLYITPAFPFWQWSCAPLKASQDFPPLLLALAENTCTPYFRQCQYVNGWNTHHSPGGRDRDNPWNVGDFNPVVRAIGRKKFKSYAGLHSVSVFTDPKQRVFIDFVCPLTWSWIENKLLLVERFIHNLKAVLGALHHDQKNTLDKILHYFTIGFNCMYHESSKYTPASLFSLRELSFLCR
jgi:hypothetical protein